MTDLDVKALRESHPARRPGPGLRVQIVLALAGVILVAYVPLFFAIAQVTRATSLAYREESARTLGRAVAAHVSDVSRNTPDHTPDQKATKSTLESHVGEGGALAVAVIGGNGGLLASAGPSQEVGALKLPKPPFGEAATRVVTSTGSRALDVVLPSGEGAVLVRVRTDEDSARTSDVVRGIALYMGVFALALLFFAYMALTRAIVRPIEQLARAADRVANGARTLDVPGSSGAREIAELGTSVRSMAARLIAEEKAMRDKVDELSTTKAHLGSTRDQLAGSERMASVGKLAAGVAHEIGNPIAAIMGMHDLMDDAEIPAEERADFLRRMRKETERINVVVRDLLDYARPEDGPPSGGVAVADVKEIVNDALALVRPQKDWKGIEAKVEIEEGLRVLISPQRLTQVMLNLLLNAAAEMTSMPADKPRTITVRAKRREVKGAIRGRIEVEDTGPGIAPAVRDRVFDPFVTTKEVGQGTGLGLSVCRGIVEAASGRISVDASYKDGARFVVELPAIATS